MNIKTIIKRAIYLIILIVLAIACFVFAKSIPSFLVDRQAIAKNEEDDAILAMAPGAVFEVTPSNLVQQGGYWRVLAPGIEQIYCAQKGGHLSGKGSYYEDVDAYTKSLPGRSSGWVDGGRDYPSHGSICEREKVTKMITHPYYFIESTKKANYAEAFILTWPAPDWNSWNEVKQEAIWDVSTLSVNKKDPKPSVGGIVADVLVVQAAAFHDFRTNIDGNGGKIVKNGDSSSVQKYVDQAAQEYKIGPFTLNYVDGNYGIVFGGISNMYVVAGSGNLPIKRFVYTDGSSESPNYFKEIDPKNLVDIKKQQYPEPGQEFYVVIDATSDEQVNKLHVDFKWMDAEATITKYYSKKWMISKDQVTCRYDRRDDTIVNRYFDSNNQEHTEYEYHRKAMCTILSAKMKIIEKDSQNLLSAVGRRWINEENIELNIPDTPNPPEKENLQISLGGHVWEDEDLTKETKPNGEKDDKEKFFEGVEVYLYYLDGGLVESSRTPNPVVTKEDGYYQFDNLDSKKKYYINFVYDGQLYQATEYTGQNLSSGFSNAKDVDREGYNQHFKEIASAPQNYKVRRALYKNVGDTNTSWVTGKYSLDGSKDVNETSPYGIREIYEDVRKQAVSLGSYSAAYSSVLGKNYGYTNEDMKSILQFIEDCRIEASTKEASDGIYPLYDDFVITKRESVSHNSGWTKESVSSDVIEGKTCYYIYDWHFNIDFGINVREKVDLALTKDVEKATLLINGKKHTYTYDTLDSIQCKKCEAKFLITDLVYNEYTGEEKCPHCGSTEYEPIWDIGVRITDGYYKTRYSRELYSEDYEYKASDYIIRDESGNPVNISEEIGKYASDELDIYVTYKILVHNQSQIILTKVNEIADYFDKDYEFVDKLPNESEPASYIQMVNGVDVLNGNKPFDNSKLPLEIGDSIYANGNSANIDGYDKLYVHGLNKFELTPGQTASIYLTFRVKKDENKGNWWIRLDETVKDGNPIGVGKENIAEINGYESFYDDGAYIPNFGDVKGYTKVAGLFDRDSVVGNIDDTISNYISKNATSKSANKTGLLVTGFKDLTDDNEEIAKRIMEDDSDKAPNIRLVLYRENNAPLYRTVDGVVWDDIRNQLDNEQKTNIGNGLKDDGTAINGVTVQLVEIIDNQKGKNEFVWKQFSTGQMKIDGISYDPIQPMIEGFARPNELSNNGMEGSTESIDIPNDTNNADGYYSFRGYVPGNYIIRYIYGDTVKTVIPGQWNTTSYNGQDYKSTIYQNGIEQNGVYSDNTSKSFVYDITKSETVNASDAKDIWQDSDVEFKTYYRIDENKNNRATGLTNDIYNNRCDVMDYSDNEVTNYIAEVLASHKANNGTLNYLDGTYTINDWNDKVKELCDKTQMTAETGTMNVEIEYDRTLTQGEVVNNDHKYNIREVDLGLTQRPKSQLVTDKSVVNVTLTLADGSTLFDASQKATNVLWKDHTEHKVDFDNNMINKITLNRNASSVGIGLIQLTMDEELMHGATIKVAYELKVSNKGEVDYKDLSFYYTGKVEDKNTIVKTKADQLVDYVANNLRFAKADNDTWEVIEKNDLFANNDKRATLVNLSLKDKVEEYNTVITTTGSSKLLKDLVPEIYNKAESTTSDKLILTQLITSENDGDDLSYRNIVEIVKTSNDVGRRHEESIVGNQDPTKDASEVDTDVAQYVRILPPYGNLNTNYVIAIVVVLSSLILIAGIVIIKKTVLNNKK